VNRHDLYFFLVVPNGLHLFDGYSHESVKVISFEGNSEGNSFSPNKIPISQTVSAILPLLVFA